MNGGTAIPEIPDTNWRTPVSWSPTPDEEKHESWDTEERENSGETGSEETEEESESSEESGSQETNWWSETEEESENSEETDTKKNWWSSWNHGKDQGKQHMKSNWYQNYMKSSETHDNSDSQEGVAMGELAKLAKGFLGSAGAFGGLNAEVENMEVNMSGLRMESGFAASGKGGQSNNITQKMNVTQMAVAPQRKAEDGIVSSVNFSIDKIEMKLNGLKIGMGGGEGIQGLAEGSMPSNIHEAMMKSHFRHMGSKNSEDSD